METWEKEKSWECFSSGEKPLFLKGYVYSKCFGCVKSLQLSDSSNPDNSKVGQVIGTADVEEDPVLAFCINASHGDEAECRRVFTSHKSGMVRTWSGTTLEPCDTLRCDHRGPISLLLAGSPHLVTASADQTIKLWNIERRHCEGILRGSTSVPLILIWANVSAENRLIVSGQVDGNVVLWNMESLQAPVAVLDKHRSQISAMVNDEATGQLVTAGRDKLIAFWNLSDFNCTKVIPSFEEIETLFVVEKMNVEWLFNCGESKKKKSSKALLPDSKSFCLSGGEKGCLRLWNLSTNTEVVLDQALLASSLIAPERKLDTFHVEDHQLFLSQDDLISVFDSKSKGLSGVFCTNHYEVLDFAILEPSFLVVATGSPDVKVYNLESGSLSVGIGHTDAVLSVATLDGDNSHFISCGKDQSVRLWRIVEEQSRAQIKQIAFGTGHSSYVGALALSTSSIFSASKDGILKLWKRPEVDGEDSTVELHTVRTVLAHNQDINCIDVSGDFLATGSQDKTCKLWNSTDLSLLTTLSGHRRGIWSCRFVGRNVITASADCTIRIWETNQFTCLHTLEGHLSSVLSVCSLSGPSSKHLASVASDGLLKIWNSDSGQCIGSFDAHDDKIWAVAAWKEKIFTGGRDGQMIQWHNITEQVRAIERQKMEELVKTDQKLQNYLATGQLEKALRLSIRLERPRQTRKTLDLLKKRKQLEPALSHLNLDERNALFQMLVQWNAIGTFSALAQDVLKYLLQDALVHNQPLSGEKVAGILSFSEKHYQRIEKLHSRLAVVDLLLQKM